jgi:hypothetical protein
MFNNLPNFDSEKVLLVIIGALLLSVIFSLIWLIRMEIKLRRVLVGKRSKSIDDSLSHIDSELAKFRSFSKDAEEAMEIMAGKLESSIRSVETVRFNPFKGSGFGGNQSFATSFLDEKGNGVVVSSLYSRDRVSVFSKPIKDFSSEFDLSAEEKEAIKIVDDGADEITQALALDGHSLFEANHRVIAGFKLGFHYLARERVRFLLARVDNDSEIHVFLTTQSE